MKKRYTRLFSIKLPYCEATENLPLKICFTAANCYLWHIFLFCILITNSFKIIIKMSRMISLFQSLNVFPAILCIIITLTIIDRNALDFPICERVKRNRIRNRDYAITVTEELDEIQFRKMLRMSRAAFKYFFV